MGRGESQNSRSEPWARRTWSLSAVNHALPYVRVVSTFGSLEQEKQFRVGRRN